jgi:hypothetical protein
MFMIAITVICHFTNEQTEAMQPWVEAGLQPLSFVGLFANQVLGFAILPCSLVWLSSLSPPSVHPAYSGFAHVGLTHRGTESPTLWREKADFISVLSHLGLVLREGGRGLPRPADASPRAKAAECVGSP